MCAMIYSFLRWCVVGMVSFPVMPKIISVAVLTLEWVDIYVCNKQ